ncbi:acid-resistance protein [Enterobacteriaceae bacterium RIT691]|nr:acid-resistance protein [Enterobacteriaceae bacterium RIT691]
MLNKYFVANLAIVASALVSSCAVNAIAADKKSNDITCQEFVDLNPQTMSPVAFWVYNDDQKLKGGDYVSLQETETVAVPLTLQLCKDKPQAKIKDFTDKVKGEIKKEVSKAF